MGINDLNEIFINLLKSYCFYLIFDFLSFENSEKFGARGVSEDFPVFPLHFLPPFIFREFFEGKMAALEPSQCMIYFLPHHWSPRYEENFWTFTALEGPEAPPEENEEILEVSVTVKCGQNRWERQISRKSFLQHLKEQHPDIALPSSFSDPSSSSLSSSSEGFYRFLTELFQLRPEFSKFPFIREMFDLDRKIETFQGDGGNSMAEEGEALEEFSDSSVVEELREFSRQFALEENKEK